MQCLCTFTVFVGYFMREKHLRDQQELKNPESMTTMVAKVFEDLWRDEFEGYTRPHVNIRFFSKFMKQSLSNATNCGVLALRQILQLMSAE